MHLLTLLVVLVPAITCLPQSTQIPNYTKLTEQQVKHLQNKGFGPTVPTAQNQPNANYNRDDEENEEENESVNVASTQVRAPIYNGENYPIPNAIQISERPQSRPQVVVRKPIQQQYRPQYSQEDEELDAKRKDEEEDKEEPDRLSILLPQSRFDCTGKNTGYYADENLGCEVFHYCQDNARHSWICPEGFTFHQVHLICMPPGGDNICEKSSQFHFVNEYLYKPLNLEEHQSKPNISLRYSDRYYPENYYSSYEEEDEVPRPQKQPIQIGLQQTQQQQIVVRRPTTFSPTIRPETTVGQVFRSPEEVNISLQQRRPQYVNQRYQNVEY
ncbi:hypothetical protein Trydic_g5386 [Trypoxylus dichotomus]